MSTPEDLARHLVSLPEDDLAHLRRLMGYWGLLADLCFSDLLLAARLRPDPIAPPMPGAFVVLAQIRPTTGRTILQEDLVGAVLTRAEQPLLAQAFDSGEVVDGEAQGRNSPERVRVQCIPVRRGGHMVAVLMRQAAFSVGRRPGELERVYTDLFERFARMLVEGSFPYPGDEPSVEDSPRVGDGVLVLDEHGRVVFCSPNAVSALHRSGVRSNAVGMRLGELGVDERAVSAAYANRVPAVEECERSGIIFLLRCLPLLGAGRVEGGLLLLRDVTDLRRRDRLLVSKDATIREIHHRVKNNLQTISSLLRLQARRVGPGEGRDALRDAERRVRSIAVVHDFLSRDVADEVRFDDIVQALVHLAEESVPADRHVELAVVGDVGELPAGVATPLAVVVSELLQNAVAHAFNDCPAGRVELRLAKSDDALSVVVADDGPGLPETFRIEATGRLGLAIVRDLVEGQLLGSLELTSGPGPTGLRGLEARVRVPLGEDVPIR